MPGPFLVAFPLGVVPASGYFFTVFWLSKIEVLSGPTTRLSRAEYAKLERKSLARELLYNYNKINIFDRDLIVIHVSK